MSKKTLFASSILSSFSSLTFGINLTLLGCVENIFREISATGPSSRLNLTESEWSSIMSIFSIGALISNLLSPRIRLKKKNCLIANNTFYVGGLLLLLWAYNYWVILLSRFLVGIGMGFTCAYVPLYLESISPIDIRGRICSLHQLCIVFGILIGQILSFYYNMPTNWRSGISFVIFYIFLHTLALFIIYDTSKDNRNISSKSILELLKHKRARLSIITAIILHSAQQLSCINGVLFYPSKLLKKKDEQRLFALRVGITFVVATIISMFFVDRCGRKPLLLLSILVDIISLITLCVSQSITIPIIIFVIGFSFGLGPIVWFTSGEIFPEEYKSSGAALAVAANWILTYLVSISFPFIFSRYGELCFSFYACSLIFFFVYILKFFQETRGKIPDFQGLK